MATLYLSGRYWAVKYCWEGRRYTRSLKTEDRKEAESLAAEIEAALRERSEEEAYIQVDSVAALAARYLKHVDDYHKGGRRDIVRNVVRAAVEHSGHLSPLDFGPKRLKALRNTWVKAGHRRQTCNDYTAIVKAMFRWAVEEELVPEYVFRALQCVAGLQKGRTEAPESVPRRTVTRAAVMKTLEHLPRTLKAMVLLQYWTGARPGEIFGLAPEDIDRSRDIWVAAIHVHKNTWRKNGKPRFVAIPAQAQELLAELLEETAPGQPLFQPVRAMRERWAECATHRAAQTDDTCGHIGERYDKDTYRRAVVRACERAGVERWTPYQLRHTAATEIEAESGPQAARAALGHASLNTTQLYLHTSIEAAMEAARNRR